MRNCVRGINKAFRQREDIYGNSTVPSSWHLFPSRKKCSTYANLFMVSTWKIFTAYFYVFIFVEQYYWRVTCRGQSHCKLLLHSIKINPCFFNVITHSSVIVLKNSAQCPSSCWFCQKKKKNGALFLSFISLPYMQRKELNFFFSLVSVASEPVMRQEKDYLHTDTKIRVPLSLDSLPPYDHLAKLLLLCKY